MERQLPPAPPPALSSDAEAVSVINHSTKERDEQTYKDLCDSRIYLLGNQYNILKDTLHKAMGVADMWWGADDVNNLEQQADLGTKLIDNIIKPYFAGTQSLIDRHQSRFGVDDTVRHYLNVCGNSVMSCLTPAPGMDRREAEVAKGLAVRLAEVGQIRTSLSEIRKQYGRKILLEKGVRDYSLEHILKKPEEDPGTVTWSMLWAGLTKPEDMELWSIVPREDLPTHKRDAFEEIRNARITLLDEKIDAAMDFWDSKLELPNEADTPLESDDDEEWAEIFEVSFANRFMGFVENTKLRLMKAYNIFNFRFLGTLTSQVMFDEDLRLEALQDLERRDWEAFVQYRLQLIEVEKMRAKSVQFVLMDDTDE